MPAFCQLQQWHAFLYGTSGYAEEILPIRFGESAIAFGNICGNG